MSFAAFAKKVVPLQGRSNKEIPAHPFKKGDRVKYMCPYNKTWKYGIFERYDTEFHKGKPNYEVWAFWGGKDYLSWMPATQVEGA